MRKKRSSVPTTPQTYPTGSCVQTEKGYFYIRGTKRYRLPTQRVLESWSFPRVILSSEAALGKYKVVAKMGFRDGSLIYNIGDGKMYLIENNLRRRIVSPEALDRIGASKNDATLVSEYEVELQDLGEDLD